MDIKALQGNFVEFIKKYRFVILILAIGLILMMLPTGAKNKINEPVVVNSIENEVVSVEEKLTKILSEIHGAGSVKVMLTEATGEEKIFQTDEDRTESETGADIQIKTVIVTDSEKNETVIIKQINPPEYLGAIVICQGADSAPVRLAIVDAVAKITGLGSDRISVLRMK